MSSGILVSIVIDNYNYGRFLGDAIRSALGQTYPCTETIVVDDGSTDCSREVIARYADRVIPILKENGGQASAFNAGFAASRGDVVIFLDSDDELLPDIARLVVSAYHTNPELAKVMYRMEVIDALGLSKGMVKPAPHLPLRDGDIRRHTLTFPYDLTWMATSGNAFAARVLRQILPIPDDGHSRLADWYLSHLSALHGPVQFLEEVGAHYRLHGANNHEVSSFDLEQLRKTIGYMRSMSMDISKTASRLGLENAPKLPEDILSVSYAASRLVSLKLDPTGHPVCGDSLWRALWDGARAVDRRFDAGIPLKITYLLWLALTAGCHKASARRLAELFFFPETRPSIGGLLGLPHRRSGHREPRLSEQQIDGPRRKRST